MTSAALFKKKDLVPAALRAYQIKRSVGYLHYDTAMQVPSDRVTILDHASARTWMNQRIPPVQRLWCVLITMGNVGPDCLRKFCMSSWRGTECSEGWISESVVLFHLVAGCLLLWGGLCCSLFGLGCFFFGSLLKTSGFLHFTSSLTNENSWLTTRRFDDRQSLERARHELQKKNFDGYELYSQGHCES